jgi:hypothetical protein
MDSLILWAFVPWRIATFKEMPYKTTILAKSVNVGDLGIRVVGILWLIAALAFAVCGVGALARASWWLPATLIVAVFSFFLCIIGWPDAQIGVFINIAIAAFLLVARQKGWLL